MTPNQIANILHRLEDLARKLDHITATLRETRELAKQTNSRVKKLELWQARIQGGLAALHWAPALGVAVVAAVVGVAAGAFFA